MADRTCSVGECDRRHHAKGLCNFHYKRVEKGLPLTGPPHPPADRFWSMVDITPGCWLWRGAIASNGYGAFSLGGGPVSAHRFAWELTSGPIPEGLEVCHMCDVRRCVWPAHLFLGSHAENMADMSRKGRVGFSPRVGVAHHKAVLNPAAVRDIRRRSAAGESGFSLARSYVVTSSTIYAVLSGLTWSHVE